MAYDRQKSNGKIVAWLVGLVSLVVLVLGGWQIFINITDPFILDPPSTEYLTADEENQQKLAELQLTDTDKDGLSDFDELYTYNTSPYLADSDSDNITDKAEVEKGTNPNCPAGKDCVNSYATTGNPLAEQATSTTLDSAVTADQIRLILINSGAPANTVNSMTDSEIMALYAETVSETGTNPLENTNNTTSTNSNGGLYEEFTADQATYTYESLQNLSATEIRELMKSVGVTQATLDAVDDETLLLIYKESLAQQVSAYSQAE